MESSAFQFRQDIDTIKTQLEETVKNQLDLFYETRLAPSQASLVRYSDKIKELEIEKISMTDELSKIRHYNELLNEKIVSLQDEIASFSKVSQVVKLQNKNSELQIKVTELENIVSKLQRENNELHKTNAQLNYKLDGLLKNTLPVVSNPHSYLIRFDGASRGNPGVASAGYICYRLDENKSKTIVYKGGDYIGDNHTNNVAEYSGLLFSLNHFIENTMNVEPGLLTVEGDSQLIINQLNGTNKVKTEHLISLYDMCREKVNILEQKGWTISFEHITRDKNNIADGLCNEALDNHLRKITASLPVEEPVQINETPVPQTEVVSTEPEKPHTEEAVSSKEEITAEQAQPDTQTTITTTLSTEKTELENNSTDTPKEEPVIAATLKPVVESELLPPANIIDTATTEPEKPKEEKQEHLELSDKIIHTLKKIKGVEYFIGSDNFLYAKNEDGTVGAKVGQKSGERTYKFFK